jgi:hypothetical protein
MRPLPLPGCSPRDFPSMLFDKVLRNRETEACSFMRNLRRSALRKRLEDRLVLLMRYSVPVVGHGSLTALGLGDWADVS